MTVKQEMQFSFYKAVYIFILTGWLTNRWRYMTKHVETISQWKPFYVETFPSVSALRMKIVASLKFWKCEIKVSSYEYWEIEGT
jgi:hypothetical protein